MSLLCLTGPALTAAPQGGSGSPQWQVNQPTAHLDVDGAAGDPSGPIHALKCIDEAGIVNLHSVNEGMPWELALTLQPGVGLAAGGMQTSGGQIVNADVSDPAFTFAFGQAYANSFASQGVAFRYPVPFEVYFQMGVMDPSHPDGLALSALCGLEVVPRTAISGPTGDDEALLVDLAAPPLCLGSPVTFYGVQYTELYILSNGCVTFEADGGPTIASQFQLQHGDPRVAAFWSDLHPNLGGIITAVVTGGVLTVEWMNVPHGTGLDPTTVAVSFDTGSGAVRIENISVPGPHPETAIMGISSGHHAPNQGITDFNGLAGLGLQTMPGNPQRMVYGLYSTAGPPMSNVSAIEFPQADGSQVEVFSAP